MHYYMSLFLLRREDMRKEERGTREEHSGGSSDRTREERDERVKETRREWKGTDNTYFASEGG